jgi:hypothetical protein
MQRRPSALLRAVSLSNGRWTFYEAVILAIKKKRKFKGKKQKDLKKRGF